MPKVAKFTDGIKVIEDIFDDIQGGKGFKGENTILSWRNYAKRSPGTWDKALQGFSVASLSECKVSFAPDSIKNKGLL